MRLSLFIGGAWIALFFVFAFKSSAFADGHEIAMKEVRGIISAQIDAFKKNDFKKAYTFAAPNIKAQFASPEVFGLMVRKGYPVIWRPKSYKFTKFKSLGNRCIQRVLFQSYDSSLETYDYILEKNDDIWQISGVLTINLAGET